MFFFNKQSNEIADQAAKTMSLITDILKIHLNIGQSMMLKSTAFVMSLESVTIGLLSNKAIELSENAEIHIPLIFTLSTMKDNPSVLLRVSE